ncbi:hypothetical protein [Reinekea sp. G2M2-21]|uniref:hypothetical protein n=1 Tax=Reinekea sp. G2M2-21 TaxID=2788942 RepID=UPI0018AB5557|nr:hypothetical protein [Reinekea sp. G2M2-21]
MKSFTQHPLTLGMALCTTALLSACGEPETKNSAPSANGVQILYGADQLTLQEAGDDIWTEVELTGSFTYSDAEQDPANVEGHQYRWLVDGKTVSTSLSFTPSRLDHDKEIRFEVTPAAASGSATGTPTATSPLTLRTKERLFFTATAFDEDQALYVTDGSADNTVRIGNFVPGVGREGREFVTEPFMAGDRWVFSAQNVAGKTVLASTDATAEGTILLDDGELADLNPNSFKMFNGYVYFRGFDADHGTEMWRTDGTAEGTERVTDIVPGINSSYAFPLTVMNEQLYFMALHSNKGFELHRMNAAHEYSLVKDINPGAPNARIHTAVAFNNRLYFGADNGVSGEPGGKEPWVSDGTEAGTVMLKNINTLGSSTPQNFVAVGDTLYFIASSYNGEYSSEVWRTRGTPESTLIVSETMAGATALTPFGDRIAYGNRGKLQIAKPLKTEDGSNSRELITLDDVVNLQYMVNLGGNLVFASDIKGHGQLELRTVKADTPQTVETLADLNGVDSSYPKQFAPLNGKLLFTAADTGTGNEIWITDGTSEGTQLLIDLYTGANSSNATLNLPVDGLLR